MSIVFRHLNITGSVFGNGGYKANVSLEKHTSEFIDGKRVWKKIGKMPYLFQKELISTLVVLLGCLKEMGVEPETAFQEAKEKLEKETSRREY